MLTFQVKEKEKSAAEINLFNFKQILKSSQLNSGNDEKLLDIHTRSANHHFHFLFGERRTRNAG
jgi:hypothetical protein